MSLETNENSSPSGERRERMRLLRDAFLVFSLACLGYHFLGQNAFYKYDGQGFVVQLEQGVAGHHSHVFYPWLLTAYHRLLETLGSGPFVSARSLSASGTAMAVALALVAFRVLGYSRAQGFVLALLFASAPPVLFFATVIELHGPFLACASLAFLVSCQAACRPGLLPAIVLGLVSGASFGVHGSGALLPGLMLPWLLVEARRRDPGLRPGRLLALLTTSLLVHAAVILVIQKRLGTASASYLVRGIGHPRDVTRAPAVLLAEWLWPFFPWSLALLGGVLRRSERPLAFALILGLLPYLLLCFFLISGDPEGGAYLLPWMLPATVLIHRSLPRRWLWLGIVVAIVLAVHGVWKHESEKRVEAGYASGAQELAREGKTMILVGQAWEMDSLLIHAPQIHYHGLWELLAVQSPNLQASFAAYIDALRRSYALLVLSAEGEKLLGDEELSLAGPLILASLKRLYRLEPVAAGSLRGKRIRPPR